jgi:hypothetical protein
MATRGVKITNLNTIANSSLTGNIVIPVVDPTMTLAAPDGETLKTSVNQLANFILNSAGPANVANTVRNNAQPNITSTGTLVGLNVAGITNLGAVANVKITGGTAGQTLTTYGNGTLYWGTDSTPGQPNNSVQFNSSNAFAGSANFTFNNSTSTLSVTNINVGNIDANTATLDTLTVGNLNLPVGNGTQQQVLGIINQSTQQLGWKTVPVYYVTVNMRDGSSYLSSPDPVLRVYPVGQRDGSFLDLNVTQI